MYLLQRKNGDIKREGESICISFPRTREMREISSSRLTDWQYKDLQIVVGQMGVELCGRGK